MERREPNNSTDQMPSGWWLLPMVGLGAGMWALMLQALGAILF